MMNTHFKICTKTDEPAIIDFLWSVKEDFFAFDKPAIEKMTQCLFDQGGWLAGYKQAHMIALLGYFFGEPSRDYLNKEVGFIYLTAIAKSVRMTRVFRQGLHFTIETLKAKGIQEVRFHAAETDPYTNRLYAHFAQPLGKELNPRGYPSVLYGAAVDDVLAYLAGQGQASAKRPTPDSYHQNARLHKRT